MPPADPFHVVRDGMDAAALSGGVIAIGNFDGVHRGHQAVIDAARNMASGLDVPACAMTFEPHPRQLFQPEVPLFRLSLADTKLKLLQAAGLDGAVVAQFDREFAAQSAEAFIDDVLIYSSVAGVFAGTNFEQVVILSDNFQLTDVGNFDNLLIDTDFQDNADVALTKTVAAPAAPTVGDTVTYTLAASNAGPGDAMNVVVTDTLPANLTYVSNTCGAAVAGQVVTWTIGALANGANASCDVVTTINNFGPINNSAAITSDTMDPNAANNSATASLGGVPFPADVGVTLTASTAGGLAVGDTFVYTVTGTNFGPGDATGVLFALTLSNKVSFVSSDCGATVAGNVVSFTVPTLANGATTSCAITVAVVLGGDLQATASVTTATVDPNLVNNVDGITIGFDVVPVPALDRLGLLLAGLLVLGLGLVATRRF